MRLITKSGSLIVFMATPRSSKISLLGNLFRTWLVGEEIEFCVLVTSMTLFLNKRKWEGIIGRLLSSLWEDKLWIYVA